MTEDEERELACAISKGRAVTRYRRRMSQLGIKARTYYLTDEGEELVKKFIHFLRGESVPGDPAELEYFESLVQRVGFDIE